MEALSSAFSEKVRFCSLAIKAVLLSRRDDQPKKLSEGQLLAPTVELTKKDGIWFIDTDKSWDPSDGTNNLLADLVRRVVSQWV